MTPEDPAPGSGRRDGETEDIKEGTEIEELDLAPAIEVRSTAGTTRTLAGEAFVRASLAILFVVIFLVTILFAFNHTGKADWPQTKELLQVLLPAETGLLGSAVGYYYGSRQ